MIVLDASIVVELLLNGPLSGLLRLEMDQAHDTFIVPHLLDVEVISAIRGLARAKRIHPRHGESLLLALAVLRVTRYPHTPLLGRIWELRNNFTAYDAAYIALAEATDSVLYTSDEKLSTGHRARVAVFTH